jgi:hypothetical protein
MRPEGTTRLPPIQAGTVSIFMSAGLFIGGLRERVPNFTPAATPDIRLRITLRPLPGVR